MLHCESYEPRIKSTDILIQKPMTEGRKLYTIDRMKLKSARGMGKLQGSFMGKGLSNQKEHCDPRNGRKRSKDF